MEEESIDYRMIYGHDFFYEADGIREWRARKLKYGDALAAIGYALGLPSLEAVRAAVPFGGVGCDEEEDGLDASGQLARLLAVQTRSPAGILEIGSGRGEVAVSLAHLGYPVQAVEPSPGAAEWLGRTAQQLFGRPLAGLPLRLLNAPVAEVLDRIEWHSVDTILMVESLEHILERDFATAYGAVRDHLRTKGGRFIVTNWTHFHPIGVGRFAAYPVHCRLVDDALYDAWAKEAQTVAYRNGSHLVLEY